MAMPVPGTDAETLKLLTEYQNTVAEHSENMLTLARLGLLSTVDKSTEDALQFQGTLIEDSSRRFMTLHARIAERIAQRWVEYYHPSVSSDGSPTTTLSGGLT